MSHKYWLGKKRSEETRKKIGDTQRGRKQSPETIKKRSESLKKIGKGRQSFNYKNWRKQVLERDGNKCVTCGCSEEKLHCDHIKPWKDYPELRFDVDNGQTLCAKCHLRKGRESGEITEDVKSRFKKGHISWATGKKQSEEHRQKNSESHKGLGVGNQHAKGHIPWNKGISLSEETKQKISNSKKGQTPWISGKNHTEETKEKCRLGNLGKRLSPKTEFKKGMIPWNKGKKGSQVAWNKGLKFKERHDI